MSAAMLKLSGLRPTDCDSKLAQLTVSGGGVGVEVGGGVGGGVGGPTALPPPLQAAATATVAAATAATRKSIRIFIQPSAFLE
jgi:hypothetical protein